VRCSYAIALLMHVKAMPDTDEGPIWWVYRYLRMAFCVMTFGTLVVAALLEYKKIERYNEDWTTEGRWTGLLPSLVFVRYVTALVEGRIRIGSSSFFVVVLTYDSTLSLAVSS
jgi:hypothetical protein